ncbi:unnamed protein product [Urochloa humidicola]
MDPTASLSRSLLYSAGHPVLSARLFCLAHRLLHLAPRARAPISRISFSSRATAAPSALPSSLVPRPPARAPSCLGLERDVEAAPPLSGCAAGDPGEGIEELHDGPSLGGDNSLHPHRLDAAASSLIPSLPADSTGVESNWPLPRAIGGRASRAPPWPSQPSGRAILGTAPPSGRAELRCGPRCWPGELLLAPHVRTAGD